MFTHTPEPSWSAQVKVMCSAFCAKILAGSRQASMTESRVTTAYPAECVVLDKTAAIWEVFNI
jgi:hypothetical protein